MTTVLWLYLYVYSVNNVKYDNLSTCIDHPIRLIDRKSNLSYFSNRFLTVVQCNTSVKPTRGTTFELRGIYTQRGKRAGCPSGSRPRVPQWIGLKELCGAVYNAAGPLCLRGGRPQRSLMERFFRRNRERWLVGIYRSKIQWREMGLQ